MSAIVRRVGVDMMNDLDSTSVFRIHIRPKGGLADPEVSFAYCLRQHVLGMGWAVDFPTGTIPTWDQYLALAQEKYGASDLSRVRFLHNKVKKDDLMWTRDTRGRYYLARVTSPWEYFETDGSRDADIVNVVRCQILGIPDVDSVPGKIVACFRPNKVIQRIANKTAFAHTRRLWNQLSGTNEYSVPAAADATDAADLFSLLDSETTEDVIFVYLQVQGWLVIPNSRKTDTMGFEYVLINRASHERAVVQVKTGGTPLDRSKWANFGTKVFLFQSHGIYQGDETAGVECLLPSDVFDFIRSNRALMPRTVTHWLDQ